MIWDWRGGGGESAEAIARAARRRGVVRGAIGLAVAVALFFWKPIVGVVAVGLTLVLLGVALLSPVGLYPRVERGVAGFARGVGLVVSWVTLTLVFFLVFLPLGLVLRAMGRLRLARGLEPGAASYWRAPDTAGASAARHDRQF